MRLLIVGMLLAVPPYGSMLSRFGIGIQVTGLGVQIVGIILMLWAIRAQSKTIKGE